MDSDIDNLCADIAGIVGKFTAADDAVADQCFLETADGIEPIGVGTLTTDAKRSAFFEKTLPENILRAKGRRVIWVTEVWLNLQAARRDGVSISIVTAGGGMRYALPYDRSRTGPPRLTCQRLVSNGVDPVLIAAQAALQFVGEKPR